MADIEREVRKLIRLFKEELKADDLDTIYGVMRCLGWADQYDDLLWLEKARKAGCKSKEEVREFVLDMLGCEARTVREKQIVKTLREELR